MIGFNEREPTQVITPQTPRKKGAARFAEVIGRDVLSFWKASALLLISGIPLMVGVWLTVCSGGFFGMQVVACVGGAIAGPQISGLMDTVLRSLRDEPGFWWHTYRKKWKENFFESILLGALTGMMLGTQLYVLYYLEDVVLGATFFAALVACFLLTTGIMVLMWAQLPLMNLSPLARAKNAVLLFLINPIRCTSAATIWLLYVALIAFFAPYSLTVVVLTGVWFPCSIGMLMIYQLINEQFQIEGRL